MLITSAAGILSLLDEEKSELKCFALRRLNDIVDEFWPEISDIIEKIEILYEDKAFPERGLAAALVSKVYFHLGAYEESLMYLLESQEYFDVHSRTEYVEIMLVKCLDLYTKQRVKIADGDETTVVDERLEKIINGMFERSIQDGQYEQVIGLALETRRCDILGEAVKKADDIPATLEYAYKITTNFVQNYSFRNEVLRCLEQCFRNLPKPDFIKMVHCFFILNEPDYVTDLLIKLIEGTDKDLLIAYQICFDLFEYATQQFLQKIIKKLQEYINLLMDATNDLEKEVPKLNDKLLECIPKFINVLSGELTSELNLQFLMRANHSDLLILKQAKDSSRSSVCITATIIANSYMFYGTTNDVFLRDNLEWLGRVTNFAKFTAVASLGVIHHGHTKESLNLLQSYLPKANINSSGYAEGGALYALGLIHANHTSTIRDYLLEQIKSAQNNIVKHGGCLGLGLASLGSNNLDIYEQLKYNLYEDDAVSGEAAAVAIGLVMLGSNNKTIIEEMLEYACQTQHEKISRGIAIGIALMMYGSLEKSKDCIDAMLAKDDPNIRFGGIYSLAMAYNGSENNDAIRKLLHFAVSDVNDNVRRAAVISLGFILFKNPKKCISAVNLLAESHNPHVRYGAAIALGISCAGTGNLEALEILENMVTTDQVGFVRQGALIASAMIIMQYTEELSPKVKFFRNYYTQVVKNKHEDHMVKFGAILAQGIIDAGGKNVTISLQKKTGHTNLMAVVGMLVFVQHWYWFPFTPFLSLCYTPTAIVLLNKDLKMPKIDLKSNVKSTLFAYPVSIQETKQESVKNKTVVLLSISEKRKKQKANTAVEEMVVEEDATNPDQKKEKEKDKDEKEKTEDKDAAKTKAASFEILQNPARVVKEQLKYITVENPDYAPMKEVICGGVIMVQNLNIDKEEVFVENVEPTSVKKAEEEEEPQPPEPFEWTED